MCLRAVIRSTVAATVLAFSAVAARLAAAQAASDSTIDVTTWADLARLVALGGPVVVVLFAISVVGLAIVLYKSLQFAGVSGRRLAALHRGIDLWFAGDTKAAAKLFERSPLALGADLHFGLRARAAASAEAVHDELVRRGAAFLRPYAALLRPLELIYYLAPVLGLLGTVLGMIDAFRVLEAAGPQADATALAGGIWEALLTTAVGLSVAIPFAAMHAALESRLEGIGERVEDLLTRVSIGAVERAPQQASDG
ncbi:MAG: MotA/TolQ/ExbB proton channel family protein [Gammaproteobacteria bacterium]|nr:MotA/TolQ/ExbB proton channel family protein [Gammaproteobacteria bacterium]